ncbi:MAG: SLC13 family permease [Bacillota bacterium]
MHLDWRKALFVGLGLAVFFLFYFLPPLPPAVDPGGKSFALSAEGQRAIGLFLLAGIWWVFEVVPIGVTSLAIGVFQALFAIRPAADAFKDFMDPTVLFILGSLFVGLAFSKAGLTKRMAIGMLRVAGEDTRWILLGTFAVTALLTHLMAHTAVAAAMFPILMVILTLYGETEKPTRFGKALFIGMAWAAGAGSMCTMMGGARNPAAVGMFKEFTGQDITFLAFSKYMLPLGWLLVLLVWICCVLFFRPEKNRIEGLRQKVDQLARELGPISRQEIFVGAVTALVLLVLVCQQFVPALQPLNRSAVLLVAGLVFFLTRFFTVEDLEKRISWNIILLFSGAMSIGFALWKTGAAQWMAVQWLALFQHAHWLVFILAMAFLVMVLTNFIMNVAAISITLPIALVMAKYMHVNPELVLFACTSMAAVPYMLLIGAAPNAIAYESKQFTTGEFFAYGSLISIVTIGILALTILVVWPLLGIPPVTR